MRDAGGIQIQEIRAVQYPFFVDIRADGMASGSPILANLSAMTLNWVSPLKVDEAKNAGRQVTNLLESSPGSWRIASTDIQPDFERYPQLGFPVGEETQSFTLAVAIEGSFESAFKGLPVPMGESGDSTVAPEPIPGTIEVSPESARLLVVGSAEFLDDTVFELSSRLTGDRYLGSLKLMLNAVAWATQDEELLDIRSRGTYTRVLAPMSERAQSFWEGANYVMALLSLVGIGVFWHSRRRSEQPMALLSSEALRVGPMGEAK